VLSKARLWILGAQSYLYIVTGDCAVNAKGSVLGRSHVGATVRGMQDASDPLVAARLFHDALPARIRQYLNARGIADPVIDLHLLGWNGRRITIPIFDREGCLAFFKLAKDPDDQGDTPKMLASPGSRAELYGWERLRAKPPRIVMCEGEFDRLVLEGQGIAAVTSTGGARVFRTAWAKDFDSIEQVYVCYDRDAVGRAGALRVAELIPQAKVVELPAEVGEGGDVTDFFVRLGKTKEDFLTLLETAQSAEPRPDSSPTLPAESRRSATSPWADRVRRIKTEVAIADVVGQYVALWTGGTTLRGLCPFHENHEPSLMVYPATGRFHCFGCGTRGDVIAFLMAIAHLSFGQALDALERLTHHDDHGTSQTGR
jgi:DNA primase